MLGNTQSGAHRIVTRVLKRHEEELSESVPALRKIEADRLDVMPNAIWPDVLKGDLAAIHTALRISERRGKLFGLDQTRLDFTNDDEPFEFNDQHRTAAQTAQRTTALDLGAVCQRPAAFNASCPTLSIRRQRSAAEALSVAAVFSTRSDRSMR